MFKKKSILFIVATIFMLMFTLQASGMEAIRTDETKSFNVNNDRNCPCLWSSRTSTPMSIAELEYVFDRGNTFKADSVKVDINKTFVIFNETVKVKADIIMNNSNGETLSKTLNYTTDGETKLSGKLWVGTTYTKTTLTNDWAGSQCYFVGN